jgi:chromosome partitioning protein
MEEQSGTKNTYVIAVGNQKGGVGKTTNTVHMAAALGEKGYRCLVWDLDVNFGATRHFGIGNETYWGTYEVLAGDEMVEEVIIPDTWADVKLPKNLHLITAARNLEGIEKVLGSEHKFFPAGILLSHVKRLRGKYDFIFLDTAPSVTTTTLAAYMAADLFILSTTPQKFAIQGLQDAAADISAAVRQGNSTLRVLGVVVSDVDLRTRLARTHIELIEDLFRATPDLPSARFQTTISRSTVVGESQKLGQCLFQTHPQHQVTEQYRKLACEIETRLGLAKESTLVEGSLAAEIETVLMNEDHAEA